MEQLKAVMQIALSNTFMMYYKSHSYHWNVEGMLFSQYHDFFGDLYEELHEAVDPMAEQIRALDEYAPGSLASILSKSTIEDDMNLPVDLDHMLINLEYANSQVIESLNIAFKLAEQVNKQGLLDFIASRLDAHAKHAWMLKASRKTTGS